MDKLTLHKLEAAFIEADNAWQAALPNRHARYTRVGRGEPNTALRAAYEAREAARAAWADVAFSDHWYNRA